MEAMGSFPITVKTHVTPEAIAGGEVNVVFLGRWAGKGGARLFLEFVPISQVNAIETFNFDTTDIDFSMFATGSMIFRVYIAIGEDRSWKNSAHRIEFKISKELPDQVNKTVIFGAKDGFAVNDVDLMGAPRTCAALEVGKSKPSCLSDAADGVNCCPGLICVKTNSGKHKCLVNARMDANLVEGSRCTNHKQCIHGCSKPTWTCNGGKSRSRRQVSSIEDPPATAPSYMSQLATPFSLMFFVGMAVVAVVVKRRSKSQSDFDSSTGLTEMSRPEYEFVTDPMHPLMDLTEQF